MRVKVTQKHIDSAEHGKPCFCPIALAIKDLKKYEEVEVYSDNARVAKKAGGDLKFVPLPPEAQTFIMEFDEGNPVEPFEFESL